MFIIFHKKKVNKITEKLDLLKDIQFLPVIDYDEDKEHLVIKLEKEAKEAIRVKVNDPTKIKIKKCKKLFNTLTKSQKHCFIFLVCCIISKKTPILQGPTASGKSYLINAFATILGQETNLYQMNSNTGMSILTGQEIIKGDFDDNEKEKICEAYNSIKDIINYKKSFNDMELKHYKRIISKIDKKLEEPNNEEEIIDKLKAARRTIFIIISPPSRFTHIDSVFIESITEGKGQWVILDGIEMAPSQIPEKITPLCGENPELSIYESGKGIYITSDNIKPNFQLFIIYNPFNKGSKILDQVLFNKCVSFTLPSIDNSQSDSATTIYNSMKLTKYADKKAWNILSSKLAASHIFSVKISESHLEQMAGGIKITPRNLAFIITDKNNNEFDDSDIDETVKWIKSSLTFYYFNSFIDLNDTKKNENSDIYTKNQFKKDIYNIFNKKQELISTTNDISENEMFPNIVKELIEIQTDSLNETSQFNFNFGNFVKLCLDVPIEQGNLEYIKNQIEDTVNLLNYSNLSKESLYNFYQIKIVEKFYSDLLNNIGSVKAENKGYKISSDELLRINSLKNILLKFRLLEGLTNKGKSNFGYCMNPILYMPEINQLILKLNSLILKKNKLALKEFVSFIFENHHFLNVVETIFPYNKFNEECHGIDFEIAFYYIKLMIEFYKNKTNFVIIFDHEEIPFIFGVNQYDRLFPILKLNEKKNIYLSVGTSIKHYSAKKGKKEMTNITIINKEENVNKTKTIHFVKLLTENSGKIDPENIKNILATFNKDNYDLISDKKFLSSNLFLTNNSIVPKIWTFLFAFNEDSEILKYIIDNLLPFEKDIFYIIKNNFYDTLNEKYQIENDIKFTDKMNFFYNEESFLWRDLIGKKLEKGLRDEEYKSYETKIENELSNLEKLKEFSWPEENINKYQQILNVQLEEIKEKIETDKKDAQLKNAQKKLTKLREKLSKETFKGGLEIYKGDIINKINKLLNENLDEMLKGTKLIETEINDLISISKEKLNSLSGNNLDWGAPVSLIKSNNDSQTIKLYKNMLYYATCNELEQKILHSKDNKERMRYGAQIEKLGLKSLLKYINSLGNEALGIENRKIIKSMFRVQLMLKLWNDSIDNFSVKNFIQNLDDRALRNQITDEEYSFTYKISTDYSLTTKIIQPNFEPKDIIYLFFQYNENNEYSAGPIFDDINSPIVKMNNLLKEVLDNVKEKKLDNMCSISVLTAQVMYRELLKEYDKKLNEKEDEFNYDKTLKFFINEEKKQESQSFGKKVLKAIINAMKLAKYFDEIINACKETPGKPVSFEDMKIFDKGKNKRIEIESLLLKDINPSFKFYIIKNLQLLKTLINSNLKNEEISALFEPQEEESYIPFWVFLIRNMSATNCINYDNENNPFSKEISIEVRENIEDLLKENKGYDLNNDWLNLILSEIPVEITMTNVRLFYFFFNNLFEKLNAEELKQKVQDIIKKFYFELLKYSFKEGGLSEILEDNFNSSEKDILKLIESPKNYIKDTIFDFYSTKTKKIVNNNSLKDLGQNLNNIIEDIPEKLNEIQENVKKIEEILKEEREKKEVENKIKEIETKLSNYNSKIDNLTSENKYIAIDIQIYPDNVNKLTKAKEEIEKYKEFIEEEEEKIIYWKIPFKNESISIRYDKDKDNKDIQVFRGNEKYLYFKIDKIDDEFKSKFSVIDKCGEEPQDNNSKKGKKNKHNNNKDQANIANQTKVTKILKDYIFFSKSEKVEIKKYSFPKNEELNNKIKKLLKGLVYDKVSFRGKRFKELSLFINELKELLSKMNNAVLEMKNGNFENLNLLKIKNDYEKKYKDLNYYLNLDNNIEQEDLVSDILSIKEDFESKLLSIKNQFEILYEGFENDIGNISNNFFKELDNIFNSNFDMPTLPEKKAHFINYDHLNLDSPLLSMPTISKKDGVLKCNYNKISFQKGPFCPEFYSKPIILNIMSLVDEDIKAEIIEIDDEEDNAINEENEENDENEPKDEKNNNENNVINENKKIIDSDGENENNTKKIINSDGEEEKNDEELEKKEKEEEEEEEEEKNEIAIDSNEDIPVIDRKDIEQMKYMRVKNYIPAKEPIQVEIYIPNSVQRGKKENQKIRRKLKLIAGETDLEVEIEMKILTIPIELLLSCENYKLEFKNGNYHLKSNQLFSKEKLIFKIQNYIEGENMQIKTRIDSMEGNTSKEPKINIEEDKVMVDIPEVNNMEVKRLNCKIECYITGNYKIPIIIDSAIIPLNFGFQIYDFLSRTFTSNSMDILIPNNQIYNNFIKFLPNNNLEIDLQFLIKIPYKNKKINALIKSETKYNSRNVTFEFQTKEILLENEKTEFKCNIKINCNNFIYPEIAVFTCKIEDETQKIVINKKDIFSEQNILLKELDFFKLDYNDYNKTYMYSKAKRDNIDNYGIYVCPFGHWNYQIVKYEKKFDNKQRMFYKLEPIPSNNNIYFISDSGEIEQKDNFEINSSGFFSKSYQFPLFGTCGEEWYPLISEYESKNDLFCIHNKESLSKVYNSTVFKNPGYYSYYGHIYTYIPPSIDSSEFKKYIEKYYPHSYLELKKENIFDQNKNLVIQTILEKIKKNKTLDVLKRFEKIKPQNNFSFSFLAYLIFEKPETTISNIKKFFPPEVKKIFEVEIDYILNNIKSNGQDWDKFNEKKYDLIFKIYTMFKGKMEEIKKNNYTLNFSKVRTSEIEKKILELQNKFYSYDPLNITKIDNLGKLSQDIEKIIQDISKAEEIKSNKKESENNIEELSIMGDKFLIIDEKIQSVKKSAKQIKPINISEINNQSNTVDSIDMDEISQPEIYSINSIMEYFGSCILKTQMLPAFIRYAVKNNNEEQITKSINILSELYNLYKSVENHNYSLISSRTEEYQKSFEIMFSKLKNAGTDFSKDQELKKLHSSNDNQIQDFIIPPEKDKFVIRLSNFETDSINEYSSNNVSFSKTNRIMFNKTGIKSIQDSQVMNLEYENLKKRNSNIPIKDKAKKKESEIKPKKATIIQNTPPPVIKLNEELQKVYSILEDKNDFQSLPYNNLPQKRNAPKKGLVKKEAENKKIVITGKNFEGQNFDVEKETNRVIEKMKNISKKKLKLDEVSEREGKLVKLFSSDKLKELLRRTVKIQEESSINKLIESSEFLSSKIFSAISELNLKEEIPFKNLEINILLDCARTIGDTEKFYVMLQVCALTTVFHALEVPYLISVVGDSGFKVVLKELDEEHSIENLQKALDCIFIKRCNTNIASCIKTATDKFKTLNEDSQRVFYMFTNGLDEEFALHEQWKDRVLDNPKHSFAFIFSKPKTIKEEQSEFLTKFWDKFSKYCKSNDLLVEVVEMSKEKLYINNNINLINEENVHNYIKSLLNVLRRYKEKDNNDKTEKGIFEISECNNIPLNVNLENLGKMITDESIREIKEEPYIKKIKLPQQQEAVPKLNQKEFKEISRNIGSILKIQTPIKDDEKNEIRTFMKLFKIKKEKINMSLLELIFKPNLATQTILTDVGTHIDVNELIKYFLNPTPNPRIYREIGDGFIKNYGVTVVIDSSVSCFSQLSSQHTWNTIQMLLSAFGAIDLPCFDLIISGNPNPIIVCSEKSTLDILSEKSQIWPIVFDLLNKNIKNTDLASAIKAAYNLHNSRKTEHPDFLFVITDGLFSTSETQRIVKNVNFCMMKGLNVFGIGVGISPFGIEKLFPSIIYSINPDKLIQGIASCFSGATINNSSMKKIVSEPKTKFDANNIIDSQKNPIFKELKNELMNIQVELSGYDYYQMEIPPDAKEEELQGDGKFSVHNYGMYEKNFFQGQKLLIVMPYSYGMNEGEDERLSYEYITKSKDDTECIQSSIDYTGIQAEVVINYKDAIQKLTREGTFKKGYCDYYACIIMSGEPYAELPNSNDDPYLFGQFINVIEQFWKNGGALGLFADNAPFNYQINILIEKLFPNSNFRVAGNHPGTQTIIGDDSGQLINNGTFNRKIQMIDNYARNIISHSLNTIYEGKTISYFVEKPNDNDLLYYGKNEELNMITDPKILLPFVPFSKDSDGGYNSVFYSSNGDEGDIVVDCSYTKFFLEMGTKGTPRYIQNIVSWLGAPEKHQTRDNCKDGSDFRPKKIDIQINWNDKWSGFKERPKDLTDPENMKTLFAVDCSGSISGNKVYFNKLRELRQKYYKSARGDKFYTWGSGYYYKNESEMDAFIASEYGPDGTYSHYIADIGNQVKNENFEHLIIVTDGCVDTDDIDKSDRKVESYGLQYSFVSTYIIGSGGNESVGCPYSRGCPGITYIIDNYGNQREQASLSREDQQALKDIGRLSDWNSFKSKYQNLFRAIRAKCLGRDKDENLKQELNKLKSRINGVGAEQNDFNQKFNELYKMADGQIRNVNSASTAA